MVLSSRPSNFGAKSKDSSYIANCKFLILSFVLIEVRTSPYEDLWRISGLLATTEYHYTKLFELLNQNLFSTSKSATTLKLLNSLYGEYIAKLPYRS